MILITILFSNVKYKVKKIKKFTDASSRKSIESAKRETDLIFNATINSIKKYARFNNPTIKTNFLRE